MLLKSLSVFTIGVFCRDLSIYLTLSGTYEFMLRRSRLFLLKKVFSQFKEYLTKNTMQNLPSKLDSSKMMKPPNVLIFTGDKHFEVVSDNLRKFLHPDKYVIYPFKHTQVLTTPWKENTALVVVYLDCADSPITDEFLDFLKKGGKMLIICSPIMFPSWCAIKEIKEDFIQVLYKDTESLLYSGKYAYSSDQKQSIVLAPYNNEECATILKVPVQDGVFITCAVHLFLNSSVMTVQQERSNNLKDYEKQSFIILKSLLTEQLGLEGAMLELPSPSPGYVITENETHLKHMMECLHLSEISLGNIPKEINQTPVIKVPLLEYSDNLECNAFDKGCYFSTLKTSYFGKTVIFFPVVTSTMYPAEQLNHLPGIVVIANRQLTGKGTRGNVWISPEGSAAFTLHFPLMLSSKLGRRLSLLQHMASLAVVHGLSKQPGYENLGFSLKWPNDIYYQSDRKIGGVLVNTTIQGEVVNIYIGIGVNVSNQRPTTCINSVIDDHNGAKCDSLSPFKIEEVIARTLTELENIVNDFSNRGPEGFFDLYYKYWIHKNQKVSLAESNQSATVESIDEYGFLVVNTADGKRLSLQPDGNRFDLMKNLIVSKEL